MSRVPLKKISVFLLVIGLVGIYVRQYKLRDKHILRNNLHVQMGLPSDQYLRFNQTDRTALIKRYCNKKSDPERILSRSDDFYRWLFVSNRLKVVACAIPKAGSTNMKLLMSDHVNHGSKYSNDKRPTLEKYKKTERKAVLGNYSRVVFVRHPFGRLWSAYTSKLLLVRQGLMETIAKDIIKLTRGNKDASLCSSPVTFREFVQYIIKKWKDGQSLNPHWETYRSLCHPCLVNFSFVGRLEDYDRDIESLRRSLSLSDKDVRSLNSKRNNTDSLQLVVDAGCRLNVKLRCEKMNDILEKNILYLAVEGLIDLSKDASWVQDSMAEWYFARDFSTRKKMCTKAILKRFEGLSKDQALRLIKQRKHQLKDRAFKTLSPEETNQLIEMYEDDFAMFGYNLDL